MVEVYLDRLFWVPKGEVRDLNRLRWMLTIEPRQYRNEQGSVFIRLYEETDDYIGVAREFGLKYKKDEWKLVDNTTLGDEVDKSKFVFNGVLNQYQQEAVDKILSHYGSGKYGAILQAKTGSGKSVMSLYIVSVLKVKSLVIVTKEVLMEQWIDYIRKFLPRLNVGVVRQDIDDSKFCDICVGMIHSLSMKRYEGLYDRFGLVIWDEVHRVGADVFSETSKLFRARYRLGVSATVKRWDGADNVFLWSIGEVIKFPEVPAMTPSIYFVSTDFALPSRFADKDVALEFLLKFLVADEKRNNLIVDLAVKALEKGRKVLILSHRRKHLKVLYDKLVKRLDGRYSVGFVVGGMKQAEVEEAKKRNCLLGTYQYIAEGFDCPELDTLIFATPVGNPIQPVGRIMRIKEGKKEPIVVDLVDFDNVFIKLYEARKKHYIANNYKIINGG